MFTTFNMGIGMLVIVPQGNAAIVEEELDKNGETVYRVGYVEEKLQGEESVILTDG